MSRLGHLIVKEIAQFFRDRVVLLLVLWLYTAEVVICAYALSLDVNDLPLAVLDRDRSPASRALVERLEAGEGFRIVALVETPARAERLLQQGRVRAVLTLPEAFDRDLRLGQRPAAQLLVDGTNSNAAAAAQHYLTRELQELGRSTGPAPPHPAIRAEVRTWFNPTGSYTPFIVLSMIALAAMLVGIIHPAATMVREKETGTLEQLRVTPVRTGELLLAKTLPTLLMGTLALFPSLLITWWFEVPMRGNLGALVAFTGVFLISAIALGILVAAVCRTLQQALLLAFFGLFPVMMLSGTLVPLRSMPPVLEYLALVSPLTHYLEILLAIFLKGSGLAGLWEHGLALVGIGAVLYWAAAVLFLRRPS